MQRPAPWALLQGTEAQRPLQGTKVAISPPHYRVRSPEVWVEEGGAAASLSAAFSVYTPWASQWDLPHSPGGSEREVGTSSLSLFHLSLSLVPST